MRASENKKRVDIFNSSLMPKCQMHTCLAVGPYYTDNLNSQEYNINN